VQHLNPAAWVAVGIGVAVALVTSFMGLQRPGKQPDA
jgi:hypothetical protein